MHPAVRTIAAIGRYFPTPLRTLLPDPFQTVGVCAFQPPHTLQAGHRIREMLG
jgi:hypothetical protein